MVVNEVVISAYLRVEPLSLSAPVEVMPYKVPLFIHQGISTVEIIHRVKKKKLWERVGCYYCYRMSGKASNEK